MEDGNGFLNSVGGGTGGYVAGSDEQLASVPFAEDTNIAHQTLPTFADLVSGAVAGRSSDKEITYYENQGNNGLQFASCGAAVYTKCKQKGLGIEIPTEWFLDDIRN